jgi:hypothetical protein
MDANYMAGENQKNVSREEMINGSLATQAELARTWGYALIMGNLNQVSFAPHANQWNMAEVPNCPMTVSDELMAISAPPLISDLPCSIIPLLAPCPVYTM